MKYILQNTRKASLWAISLVAAAGLLGAIVVSPQSMAVSGKDQIEQGAKQLQTGGANTTVEGGISTIVDLLLWAIGAVSVIMLIVGGLRFATSSGNADQIKQAKNIILYAVIGLVIAIAAFAVVRFVTATFGAGSGDAGSGSVGPQPQNPA